MPQLIVRQWVGVVSASEAALRFPLRSPMLIGREQTMTLTVPDALASKHHCRIEQLGTQWFVRDLQSLNGTWVNELRVLDSALFHGDLLRIGDTIFLFDDQSGPRRTANAAKAAPAPAPPELRKSRLDLTSLVANLTMSPAANDKTSADVPLARSERFRDLALAMARVTTPEELLAVLGNRMSTIVRVERASLFLCDLRGTLSKRLEWKRSGSAALPEPSLNLLDHALQERVVLLTNSTANEGVEVRSLLALPLVRLEQTLGVLSFETHSYWEFKNEELDQVLEVAVLLAVVVDNFRLLGMLETNKRVQ